VSGIALTALLAVVAVASRAHRPGGGTTAGTPHAPQLLFDYIASAMLVLMPLGAIVVVWALAQRRREKLLEGQTSWRHTLVSLAILAAFFTAAVYLRSGHGLLHWSHVPGSGSGSGHAQTTKLKPHTQPPAYHSQFRWIPAVVVGSIALAVAVVGVAAFVRSRREGEEWNREAELAAALNEVLADTLDDLRAERDPRRAVIRTYARMERTFAAYGVPREEAETPLEYVARVLDALNVSVFCVRRLTQLFSRAKFSPHEVDAAMKDEAIEALAGLRAELEHGRVAA